MAKFVNKKVGEPVDVEATIKFDGLTQPSGFTVIFALEGPWLPSTANYMLVIIERNGIYKIRSTLDTSKLTPGAYRLVVVVRDVDKKIAYAYKAFPDVLRLLY